MAEPINSSSNCNTCPDVMSSNCVSWAGGTIPGMNLCAGANVTDVILGLAKCCANNTAPNPCAANSWVDFSPIVPVGGTGTNCAYKITGFGSFTGEAGFPPIINDNPMYKFTKDGNIKVKGVIDINFTATNVTGFVVIQLATLSSTCLPSSFLAQTVLTEVDLRRGEISQFGNFMKAYVILNASGLQLLITYDFTTPTTYDYAISLGGVEFSF